MFSQLGLNGLAAGDQGGPDGAIVPRSIFRFGLHYYRVRTTAGLAPI